MFKEEIQFHAKLSNKAKYGAIEYEQILKYEQRPQPQDEIALDTVTLKYQIIEEYRDYYLDIFLKNMKEAIELTKEYNRLDKFPDNLENAITYNIIDILISIIDAGVYGVYDTMERVAGGMSEFWEGVENAREEMELGGGSPDQRARYWRYKVWPSAEMYEDTIAYRFQAWQDYAPYWYWIEHGNYFHSRAFPNFSQTLFLSKSAYTITDDIEIKVEERRTAAQEDTTEVEEVNKEYDRKKLNLFDKAVEDLENDPNSYPIGHVWGTYKSLEDERWYKVYRIKTGVGRALTGRKNR